MKGKILLSLFALPFAAVGVWAGYSIAVALADAWQMQNWVQTEASLTSGGYSTHAGDDSTTYEAYASYSYSAGGATYTASRVGIMSGADNIGSYQKDLGGRLANSLSAGGTVPVYYDPNAPHEAVLDRTIRWGLVGFKAIFLLLFGGFGVGLWVLAWRSRPEKDASDPAFAETPWLLNDAWQSDSIRSSSRATMWAAWAFAVVWNLISLPLPFVLVEEIVDKGNTLAAVGFLFPIIGAGLLVWAIRRTREWTRFGSVPVVLDPFPGAIGGHVGGTLDVPLPYDPAVRFDITLTSLHRYVSGSGKNRSRHEKALWQDTMAAGMQPGPLGTRLVFRFDLPEGLEPSDAVPDAKSSYAWRLNVEGSVEGVDFDRDYQLPVYPTGNLSVALPDDALREAQTKRTESTVTDIRDRLNFSYSPSGARHIHFPMGRNVGLALSGVAIGAIFATSGWFLFTHQSERFFGSVFAGIGILIALSMAYTGLNSLTVTRRGQDIVAVRRILGLPVRKRTVRAADVVRVTSKSSFQTQSGGKHTMHYSLFLHDVNGGKTTAGEGFRSKREAAAAIQFICREFGVTSADGAQDASIGDDVDILAADT